MIRLSGGGRNLSRCGLVEVRKEPSRKEAWNERSTPDKSSDQTGKPSRPVSCCVSRCGGTTESAPASLQMSATFAQPSQPSLPPCKSNLIRILKGSRTLNSFCPAKNWFKGCFSNFIRKAGFILFLFFFGKRKGSSECRRHTVYQWQQRKKNKNRKLFVVGTSGLLPSQPF